MGWQDALSDELEHRRDNLALALDAYSDVLAKANAASAKFREAQRRYRAREISDAEFIAAKQEWDRSEQEFSRARGELPPGRDAELADIPEGQQGAETGPEAWQVSRGRDATEIQGRAPPFGPHDEPDQLQAAAQAPQGLVTDPPVSEAQRKAMFAAAAGKSNLGIPQSVGREFVGKKV
jgi:hypothetical protein